MWFKDVAAARSEKGDRNYSHLNAVIINDNYHKVIIVSLNSPSFANHSVIKLLPFVKKRRVESQTWMMMWTWRKDGQSSCWICGSTWMMGRRRIWMVGRQKRCWRRGRSHMGSIRVCQLIWMISQRVDSGGSRSRWETCKGIGGIRRRKSWVRRGERRCRRRWWRRWRQSVGFKVLKEFFAGWKRLSTIGSSGCPMAKERSSSCSSTVRKSTRCC